MELNPKHIDLMDQVIRGEAKDEDLNVFNTMISQNAEFKSAYEFRSGLSQVSRADQQMKWKEKLQALEDRSTSEKDTLKSIDKTEGIKEGTEAKTRNLSFYVLRIAASLILLVACFFLMNRFNQSEGDLFASNFTSHPNELIAFERGQSGVDAPLNEAFKSYDSGDHLRSEELFGDLHATRKNKNLLFYRSISLLHLDRGEEAVNILKGLSQQKIDIEPVVVDWYLALAYIKVGDDAAAKDALNRVLKSKGKFRKQSAMKLLDRL